MNRILTILGTRPEIIRLSRIIPKLDALCDHKVLHTGQNHDTNLKDVFFSEMNIRLPDVQLSCATGEGISGQLSNIFQGVEAYIKSFKPHKVIILGDTNSGLAAIICERLGIPVFHMEAGNRCYDLKVPEEKNRKLIDSISSFNLPYTPGSRENLLREGADKKRIFVTGNPIKEVIDFYKDRIENSEILTKLNIGQKNYVLATSHRAENVDVDYRLAHIFDALESISKKYKIIFSCHPRTKDKLSKFDIYTKNPNILLCEPFGFFDFVKLEKEAKLAITDSGTVQEECCLLNTPTVTIRDTTERPETVECGSNIVSGLETIDIIRCFNIMEKASVNWSYPIGYTDDNVSDKVVNFILQGVN